MAMVNLDFPPEAAPERPTRPSPAASGETLLVKSSTPWVFTELEWSWRLTALRRRCKDPHRLSLGSFHEDPRHRRCRLHRVDDREGAGGRGPCARDPRLPAERPADLHP